MLKYLFIFFFFMLISATPMTNTIAQATDNTTVQATTGAGSSSEVEMADTLRQDGKIYVVVAVIVTVLAGLILYLIRLDRKVSKLEQQLKS